MRKATSDSSYLAQLMCDDRAGRVPARVTARKSHCHMSLLSMLLIR